MKKKLLLTVVIISMLVTGIVGLTVPDQAYAKTKASKNEMRGVWVSCFDFDRLGLSNKSEKAFRANYNKFLNKAKSDNLNTVFFHVRSCDDAVWKSSTFPASRYLSSKASTKKKAKNTYTYDPLKIVVEMTHAKGMELHAWMNPYRKNTSGYYYNPAYKSTLHRIEKAVTEVMKYKVDGIHFDDYFYSASKGYVNLKNKSVLRPSKIPSYSKRMHYVNIMVRNVYRIVKKKNSRAQFGISPAGNMDNAKSIGCDINTWMKKKGYVDYIMPQLYWTDQWGKSGKVKMFSQRLGQWTKKSLNKAGVKIYIGLGSYKAGTSLPDDKGWKSKKNNLATQLASLRKSGCRGYVLFSASDLYRKGAKTEIANLNKAI